LTWKTKLSLIYPALARDVPSKATSPSPRIPLTVFQENITCWQNIIQFCYIVLENHGSRVAEQNPTYLKKYAVWPQALVIPTLWEGTTTAIVQACP
jgi:hypothetical protein